MIDFTKDSEYIRMYGKKGREMFTEVKVIAVFFSEQKNHLHP